MLSSLRQCCQQKISFWPCYQPLPGLFLDLSVRTPLASYGAIGQKKGWTPMASYRAEWDNKISMGFTLFLNMIHFDGELTFEAGSVSPVKLDSSTLRSDASKSLKSAGILSPILRWTMSPGTNSLAWYSRTLPSRRHIHVAGTWNFGDTTLAQCGKLHKTGLTISNDYVAKQKMTIQ